jgi:hypothetical protein
MGGAQQQGAAMTELDDTQQLMLTIVDLIGDRIARLEGAIIAHRDYKQDERTALTADHADLTLWEAIATMK